MQFDPVTHTKEFLIGNSEIALELARKSAEFAGSDLANDFEILKLANELGCSVAHELAEYQLCWVNSEAINNHDVLRIADWCGRTVGHVLAVYRGEWLQSEASRSIEILQLADVMGDTIAHYLARYQMEWLQSEASKSLDILKLTDIKGCTVAHELAEFQSDWVYSKEASQYDILSLFDNSGTTVAHTLASIQPEWLKSEGSKCLTVLQLVNNVAHSVAFNLVIYQEQSIHHEPLMHKSILTLCCDGKTLAEEMASLYSESHLLDTTAIAMKLIEQGAAYKHSKTIEHHIGESLLNECKLLLEDSHEPLIAFKQLQAAYSTFAHNVAKIISTQEQESLQEWKGLLLQSENLIRQHLDNNPYLYDIEHTIDIFCEPGDDLLKKLQSERILTSDLASLSGLNNTNSSEQEPKIQSLY
jgi:hypothetical protein